MAKNPKCKYCDEEVVDKDNATKQSGRWYHNECLAKVKKKGASDYKDLIAYICELYGLKKPTGFILGQIKMYQNEYGYKYKGMELALRYFHEILDNPVKEDAGIGIIPFVYEEAKNQYVKKLKIKEVAENCVQSDEKIVYIKTQPRTNKNLIDISSI